MRPVVVCVCVFSLILSACGHSSGTTKNASEEVNIPESHIAADLRAAQAKPEAGIQNKCSDLAMGEAHYRGMLAQLEGMGEIPDGSIDTIDTGDLMKLDYAPDDTGQCVVNWRVELTWQGSDFGRSGTCRVDKIDGTVQGKKDVDPICIRG